MRTTGESFFCWQERGALAPPTAMRLPPTLRTHYDDPSALADPPGTMRTRPRRRAMYPLTALLGLLVSACQALAGPGVLGVGPFKSRPLPHIFYL
jgi:hypothetical protein